jgi:hypothetical protein
MFFEPSINYRKCNETSSVYRRELDDIGDDEDVPLICPTRQAQKNWFSTSAFRWKLWANGIRQRP